MKGHCSRFAGAVAAAVLVAACGAGGASGSKNIGRGIQRAFLSALERSISLKANSPYRSEVSVTRCADHLSGVPLAEATAEDLQQDGDSMTFPCYVTRTISKRGRSPGPAGTVRWLYYVVVNSTGGWRAAYQPIVATADTVPPCTGVLCDESPGGKPASVITGKTKLPTHGEIATRFASPKWGKGLLPMSTRAGTAVLAAAQVPDAPCLAVAVAVSDRSWALARARPSQACQSQRGGAPPEYVLTRYGHTWEDLWNSQAGSCPPGAPNAVIEEMFHRPASACSSL